VNAIIDAVMDNDAEMNSEAETEKNKGIKKFYMAFCIIFGISYLSS
jgi:hypothetical protein